ncbi:MAG: molybdopterin-binding protein, partial [Ginsengibacter sp.]
MKNINASIITIGDELLIGQVIDTNSAWMAQLLNRIGITVTKRIAVGDDAGQIRNALDTEKNIADIVLITGGLGPTSDDITKQLLCKYFSG